MFRNKKVLLVVFLGIAALSVAGLISYGARDRKRLKERYTL